MTKEQEAIERLKSIDETVEEYDGNILKTDIETVLNMLKEKDKEIEKLKADNKKAWKLNANMTQRHLSDIFKIKKKDKQIDLMANYIATLDIEEDICANVENDNCDKMSFGECEDCIKQYFERKSVKNELDRRNFTTTCKETSTRYR